MATKFIPVQIDTAPKVIAQQIKERILSGDLKTDERLPTEDELASLFNVSRHTIREGLKRLAAQNLIEARRGAAGGNFVKVPTWSNIQESLTTSLMVAASMNELTFEQLLECRLQLGQMCIPLAAANRKKENIEALRSEVAFQQGRDVNDVDFCASDVRFDSLVASCTQNPVITATVSGVIGGLEPIANLMLFRFREKTNIARLHDEIVTHIEQGDAAAAARCLNEEVEYLRQSHSSAKKWREEHRKD
ncbi:MAG TPA: FadR family transcriptional regulator [Ochrobactrum intermedium]|uniref:FadR family transcriptional regulator n=1 Tax=Brucella intermedia TaxID=94625 RepID=A0A7V6U010_9HYPH|nr:GntR family transcriptional regulator [Brucella intermedia]HHV68287.1 FadR family transcriptional regulator [Brucella intermedia]